MNAILRQYQDPPTSYRLDDAVAFFPGAVYASVPGFRSLQLDLWVPESSSSVPTVVWIHGGAWMVGDRRALPPFLEPDELFAALTDAGMAVASIEYRHALEAPFPAQLHDAKAAVRWLRSFAGTLNIDPDAIAVAGESAGGHLASLVALTSDATHLEGDVGVRIGSSTVSCAVSWFGVSDIESIVHPETPASILAQLPEHARKPPLEILLNGAAVDVRRDASPVTHVSQSTPPFFLAHGTADTVVPFEQSTLLRDALEHAGAPVTLMTVPGAGHGFDACPDGPAILEATVSYLAEHLGA
ncbi:alpha/beta hydrolase [Pseudoclavibacter sp. RFBB5]|uniref:alpha/beta hydrolase n=1 Tax=Pseudoclavibacter sp. RFBB5 TaxID=2080574 RepID=UPI000CE7C7A5|nr:alpha/beta hydrolase [Pseudoclavibacter sp. RFBB5]PPG27710.1 alpha/beta hydrolase [Pseudoclavibacter sp. RFBB5]